MFETKCLFCHEKDIKKSEEDDDLYLLLAEWILKHLGKYILLNNLQSMHLW